ncbi:hypothetical protein [Maribellus maritimus]|uniref:hypothetical protein n=1 Tax=Maribellus maritimus TaxID=2870838 RepID=UPI001EEA10FE|nr:hypothetical protein [Maribellus maritimus]MCG6187059.1 hypothetical protein [Maribellus maritimus]
MKKYYFPIFVLLLFAEILNAQNILEVRQAVDLFNTSKMLRGDMTRTLTERDIEGSPFLEDEFIKGVVYTTSNTKYVDVPLRYNIYNDAIEFDTGSGVQELAAPEIVDKVEFGSYTMVYVPYSITKKIRRGFFIVEEEGKASLLVKPEIAFVKATEPGAYKAAEPAKFDRKNDEYYIWIKKNEAKMISGKNDIVDVFPDNHEKIEAFIKKNKIKHRKPEDLKQLVQYYNSL